ncbi:Uncharacterized conserved protein, DUF305 family [Janibacter indicus]|uniref:Uncharacterized conserved protein, DUF305 family n=2 Tax=Intrasporangiaceae TaxID=85021 RepID=A0A1W2DE95_9MICO|nr:DUF305 domain-containing protein [Janibacter sp. YB324]SMC95366.1 Uncharacterized conserved protein, DUF305 family [Janibacter indicus]
MTPPGRRAALVVATTLTAGALAACSSGSDGSMSGMDHDKTPMSASDTSTTADGRQGDIMFAQMMIPHHEQAITMADLALDPSAKASGQVRDFAKDIKGAQGTEIQTMEGWLEDWDAPTASSSGMDHGSGMMTQDEMSKLESATGAEFDKQWLTLMIKHHQGAVTMAEQVLTTTEDDAVERMAKAIVKAQKAEIKAMQREL